MALRIPRSSSVRFAAPLVAAALAIVSGSVSAQVDEPRARVAASEFAMLVGEATAVIGGLQDDINAGKAGPKAVPDALIQSFEQRYAKAAGKPFSEKGDEFDTELKKAFLSALRETLTKHQPTMAKGGQDAFVPAYFRAELLKRFNASSKGRIQGYATMRDSELINADWAVTNVMKGSPLVPEATKLVNEGPLAATMIRKGDRLLSYTPMKLGAACVACHARNGMQQKEGAYGGALLVEVWVR